MENNYIIQSLTDIENDRNYSSASRDRRAAQGNNHQDGS